VAEVLVRRTVRGVAIGYVAALVIVPVAMVAWRSAQQGAGAFWQAISSAQAVAAFRLTAVVAGSAVAINVVFGVGMALLLVRYRFPGRRLLAVLVDAPVSVSPIVVGLALVLAYGPREGWLGAPLHGAGIELIYATPGMIAATAFVTLPLVLREVVPVLDAEGLDSDHAARALGATAAQRFWRITLPTIRPALAYGIVLSLARAIGEFGAVKVVSGNVSGVGQTQTATLLVDERIEQLEPGGYQVSLVLVAVAVLAIVIVSALQSRQEGR
jgi:sulfate transport system permease protein